MTITSRPHSSPAAAISSDGSDGPEEFLQPGPGAPPEPNPRSGWLLIGVGGLVVVILAALSVVLRSESPSTPTESEASFTTDAHRILVISDSLSEGQGEVTDISRTWPNVVGARLREQAGTNPAAGSTWLPASQGEGEFDFPAPRADAAVESLTDETGIPGAVSGGPVTWETTDYDAVRVVVASLFAGTVFTATPASGEPVSYTTSDSGPTSFVVEDPGATLSIEGDAAILGIFGYNEPVDDGVEVLNLSWSGSSTSDWEQWIGRPDLAPLITGFDPDVVVISLGGNDYWQTGETNVFGSQLRTLHEQVAAAAPDAARVFGTQPTPDQTSPEAWAPIQDVTLALADELDAPVIDLFDTMPGAASDPSLYAGDRTHLSDAGHAFIADLALVAITEAMDGRDAADDSD